MLLLNRRTFATTFASGLFTHAAIGAGLPSTAQGGGSSFANPVMTKWTEAARGLGMAIDYKVMGTGSAQDGVLSGDIDYAIGELPMPASKRALGTLMQFPVAFGAIAFTVNIDGVADGQLQLDATLLAGIFAGKVKKWNEPAILAANPGMKLPELDIVPMYLGDPNGAVFSTSTTLLRYLMANNTDWQAKFASYKPGARWASGMMLPTSSAMVPLMKSRQGSIGYMALGSALASGLARVKLRNKNGEVLLPTPESLRVTISRIDWTTAPDLVVDTTDLSGAGVWPLVLCSYATTSTAPENRVKTDAVRSFFAYAIQEGDQGVIAVSALPLPTETKARVLTLLEKA
jgi:phosphate transport system substrate-binding protein